MPTEIKSKELYAGFWKRVAASLIDLVIILIVFIIVLIIIDVIAVVFFGFASQADIKNINIFLAYVGFTLYGVLFECSSKQATPGKQILKIIVVDLQYKRISLGRSFSRNLPVIIPQIIFEISRNGDLVLKIICFLSPIIMVLAVSWTKKSQGLHDIFAECLVVNKEAVQKHFQSPATDNASYLGDNYFQQAAKDETEQLKTISISAADEIRKYKQLLDDGIITEEEFIAKKKVLLKL